MLAVHAALADDPLDEDPHRHAPPEPRADDDPAVGDRDGALTAQDDDARAGRLREQRLRARPPA